MTLRKSANRGRPEVSGARWKAESEDWKWVPGMNPQMPEPFTIEKLDNSHRRGAWETYRATEF
jgi:hypothetical protein